MTAQLSQLTASIAERSAQAAIGQTGPDSEVLRRYLRDVLVQPPGVPGSFLADPVIEGGFDWRSADRTMDELSDRLLHPALINALDRTDPVDPDRRNHRYRFARSWSPFSHQLEAWEKLAEEPARSVLVTSGTGSGKTECFLIPILDSLTREQERKGRLSGVQAIMLYPLNALINSQRDRLTDWIAPFEGQIRYCLYNGETSEEVRAAVERQEPWRVLSRKTLRTDPPPILVTNVTMLEYMLVRNIDAPILERSRGQLRWIVLDEAHSYVGSQAAELSLLIRRVVRAFGVASDDVRFVATSATIGEGALVRARLQAFMADVAGVPRERVDVIEGRRDMVELPPQDERPLPPPTDPVLVDPERAGAALAGNSSFRELRRQLSQHPQTLTALAKHLFGDQSAFDHASRAAALDLVNAAAHATIGGRLLLPIRLHLFHRAQPGLWACIDSKCPGRAGTALDSPDWCYGRVIVDEADHCPDCGGPALDLVTCLDCSLPLVVAEQTDIGRLQRLRERVRSDDFAQDIDPPEAEEEEEDGFAAAADSLTGRRCFIVAPGTSGAESVSVERPTGRVLDRPAEGMIATHLFNQPSCPRCGASQNQYRADFFRRARLGAPFLLGNVIPQLLEATPPRPGPTLPFGGRQLLTFTDSRQGTARFAARLQQDAERNYVRGVLYHMVQHSPATSGGGENVTKLKKQIEQLEPLAPGNAVIAEMLAESRSRLARLRSPAAISIPWFEAVRLVADRPETASWMAELWQDRDARYASPGELGEMLLLREFARRPKRQNSAETMGLVALRWPDVDKLTTTDLPAPFFERSLSILDWQDFLYMLVTYQIRASTAIAIDRDTLRWIGVPGRRRVFASPGSSSDRAGGILGWPLARQRGRRARPVHLLAYALIADPTTPEGADRIDAA